MNQHRALLLVQSRRYADAVKLLHEDLVQNPTNVYTHYLLSVCYVELGKLIKATEHAQTAIANAPDSPAGHFALARALMARQWLAEATAAIDEAIRLDASDAEKFATKSQIRFMMSDWHGGLAAAEAGLQLDPQNKGCLNLRGVALRGLRQSNTAESVIRETLSRDPENAFAHANLGWSLLEQDRPEDALDHFREALRLEPNSQFARQGLINALRCRYIVFRWFFAISGWNLKISSPLKLLLFIAAAVLAPFIWPIAIAFLFFALSSWLVVPLTNLLLMTNRYGRFALSGEEKVFSVAVGGCLVAGLSGVIIHFANLGALPPQWIQMSVMIGQFSLPLAGTVYCRRGWPRNLAYGILGVLVLLILLVPVIALTESPDVADSVGATTMPFFMAYIPVCVGAQFAVVGLAKPQGS